MGVRIKKRGGKWYVFVNYHGHRKSKCVGSSRQVAEQVRRQLEAKLVLGNVGFFADLGQEITFAAYAERWLKTYVETECKPSTARSYEQLMRVHVKPRFGQKRLSEIRREEVKRFLTELGQAIRIAEGIAVPKFSRNTLRLIACTLRAALNAALEDGLIESNPATRVGRFAKSEKPEREASAMTRGETEAFLEAVQEVCPDWFALFLTAIVS